MTSKYMILLNEISLCYRHKRGYALWRINQTLMYKYIWATLKSLNSTRNLLWRKPKHLSKTNNQPQVTGNFLTCPGRDSNPGSIERQRAVSCNALNDTAIRAGPLKLSANYADLILLDTKAKAQLRYKWFMKCALPNIKSCKQLRYNCFMKEVYGCWKLRLASSFGASMRSAETGNNLRLRYK